MRSAALASLALILVGSYVVLAASLALGPATLAIGILAILVASALTIVIAARRSPGAHAGA